MGMRKKSQAPSLSSEDRRIIQRRRLTRTDMERMRLPRRFWKSSWGRVYDPNGAIETYILGLGNLCEPGTAIREGYGLILWGDNDTGKTSAGSVVLKEARRRGFTGMFTRATSYVSETIEKVKFDEDMTMSQRCASVDVLLLDELGKEASSSRSEGATERMIEELVRGRCADLRSTIITTNIDPTELFARKFTSSFRKLVSESFAVVEVVGESQREIERQGLIRFMQGGPDEESP